MSTSSKLTELSQASSLVSEDLFYVVKDPSGSPVAKKCTLEDIANAISSGSAVPFSHIDFDTTAVSSFLIGRLRWNAEDQCPEFDTINGSTIQISQEVPIVAINKTGSSIPDGTAVYVSGAQGQRPTIDLADKSGFIATGRTIGLTTHVIADNAQGFVAVIGLVRGLNTSAITEGAPAYVDTNGTLTETQPSYPNHTMRIGYCVYQHANQGMILVTTQKGFHLANLWEVDISGAVTGDFLQRQANGQWSNHTLLALDSLITRISTPAWTTVQDFIRTQGSSGMLSGGIISDGGSQTFDVALGSGFLRSTDTHSGELFSTDWAASTGRAIADGELRHVYVEYNAGSPRINDTLTRSTITGHDSFELGTVAREGTILHITNNPDLIAHGIGHVLERFRHQVGVQRADGLILGETGTRNVTVTAGEVYDKLNEFSVSAIDTSGADTFDTYRTNVSVAKAVSQWPNIQYDTGSVLADLNTNRYGVLWFYIEDDDDGLVMIYGTSNTTTVAGAQVESPPSSLPVRLQAGSLLIGRIIFQKNAATATIIETAFGTTFSSSQATEHGNLYGLSDNDHPQYAFLSGSGQTLSNTVMKDIAEERQVVESSAGTLTMDYEGGSSVDTVMDESITTITLSNLPASGDDWAIKWEVGVSGGYTIAFPASFKWGFEADGTTAKTAPTLVNGNTYTFEVWGNDAGTTNKVALVHVRAT